MGSLAKTTSGDVSNGKDSTMLEKPLIADVRDDNYLPPSVSEYLAHNNHLLILK